MINDKLASQIVDAGIESVMVRSVIGCRTKHGVCAKCYGMGLATRDKVSIGEAVGIIEYKLKFRRISDGVKPELVAKGHVQIGLLK